MKVGIIGAGQVGATAAYAMVMRGVGREIILVDINNKRAQAEAADIMHAVPFAHPLNVTAGDYQDLPGCQVVIITAGVAQKPGETRLQLLERNATIFKQIIPEVLKYTPDTILLVTTNPVDVMTHLTAYYVAEFGVPPSRVIGSGTMLDTARFRTLLGQHLGIDSHHVHAYVIGEHGDSEVLAWSHVTVGSVPLEEFCHQWNICIDQKFRNAISHRVRDAAYSIIEGKGATYYGIGSTLARIVEVIIRDQRSLLTVSTPVNDVAGVKNISVSLPHLVGGKGILDTILLPLSLSEIEENALRSSAFIVKNAYTELITNNK
ncbi:MAG: L-lactate dehydrogenase [Chloroflexota bacterium]|nr:L-lactate dehydrogenase [Chloroflexota bacterium]